MIRKLFKRKLSKFGSLVSLAALSGMFIVFFLAIPEFDVTSTGKIFVGIWAMMALLSFIAHGSNINISDERQYVPVFGMRKDVVSAKSAEYGKKYSRSYMESRK